jgi:hypothetical protein
MSAGLTRLIQSLALMTLIRKLGRHIHVLSTQAPRSCRVSPASKLPDAPRYRLRHARPYGSVLRPKPRNPPPMVLWPNHQTPRIRPGLTTPSVEPAKPFTSGAQTVYSVLPRFLTWLPPMHRLHVHDFVLLFLHHAART